MHSLHDGSEGEEYHEGQEYYAEDDSDENESGTLDEGAEGEVEADAEGAGAVVIDDGTAEKEIESDFDRLVQDIRQKNDPNKAGVLAKDWDISIEEQDAQFHDDLRAATGIGKKRKRMRAVGPTLSHQVRALIGDGNQAYVDGDLPEAIRIMQEVIRIEPRASGAWTVLAQCYEDMNESERALQLRIMAAHLKHDAEEWEHLARQSRQLGFNQQALYCYRKVYSLDPDNVDALWDRASLAKQVGNLRTTRHAFLAILKRFPHDLTVLAELRPILIDLSDLATCASLFSAAFAHYSTVRPADVPPPGFRLMEILVLADLHNTLGEHRKAVEAIRRGCRWLQGRGAQAYWDRCQDDREYDPPEVEREADGGGDGAMEPGRYELDVNARHRLAVARIKMGDLREGKIHADIVLSQDIYDYAPLFVELADAYFEKEMYAEARPIYEMLGAEAATSSIEVLLQTAACLRNMGELKEAAEVYEQVRLVDPSDNDTKMKLAEIYEVLSEPRRALDLVYEVIASRKKRAKDTSDRSASVAPEFTSLFAEASLARSQAASKPKAKDANRLTPAQLRELEAQREKEVLRGFARLKSLEEDGKEGELEWMLEAEKLSDAFRETRALFSASRNNPFKGVFPRKRRNAKRKDKNGEEEEDRMLSRLQLDIEHERRGGGGGSTKNIVGVNSFRGINFDDWLRMFMKYAFNLTKRGQYDVAEEVLRHILLSNAYFSSKECQDTIRLSLITCAITAQQFPVCVEQARKLINAYQFSNEPFRVLVASLAAGLRPTDAFITSTLQKHMFREVKAFDAAVKNPEGLRWMPNTKRYAVGGQSKVGDGEDDDDDSDNTGEGNEGVSGSTGMARPEVPTKPNPVIVAVYGQICIAAKSYQSAIFYLLHAYDYCPDDPMICLCLAIASVGRAMQRQSDNRHHLVAQSMAFMSRYRALRGNDWEGMSEVEYNFGRFFQQLGLLSHAVKHYEHVLELAERAVTKDGGMVREAAYNLSLIYVTTGATPLAQLLYRRWLSL